MFVYDMFLIAFLKRVMTDVHPERPPNKSVKISEISLFGVSFVWSDWSCIHVQFSVYSAFKSARTQSVWSCYRTSSL